MGDDSLEEGAGRLSRNSISHARVGTYLILNRCCFSDIQI